MKKASVLSIFGSDPIFLLRGGIGNQLFIYSAGIYLGQRDSFNPIFHSLGIDHGESISEMGLPGRFMTANMSQVYRLDRRFSQRFSKRELQIISPEDEQVEIEKRIIADGIVTDKIDPKTSWVILKDSKKVNSVRLGDAVKMKYKKNGFAKIGKITESLLEQ